LLKLKAKRDLNILENEQYHKYLYDKDLEDIKKGPPGYPTME